MTGAAAEAETAARLTPFVEAIAASAPRGVSCSRNPGCDHLHLDLRPLDQVRFYQPGDLTIGADAGMTAAELNRILAPHNQWVPLDVPAPERTTLGAILAAHHSGPLRQRFGTVRDFTIGLEMITAPAAGQAQVVHCGGRVVKNVAGYDWMKLAIGARGAFGIITGVNFRVAPRPQAFTTGVFSGLTWPQVEGLRTGLLHSALRPLAIELRSLPGADPTVCVRCAGSPAVLARCRRELESLARAGNCTVAFLDGGAEAALWDELARFPQPGDRHISIPPAQAVTALAAFAAECPAAAIAGRLGLGVFVVRGPYPPQPEIPPGVLHLMDQLKRQLDPAGLMHGDACAR